MNTATERADQSADMFQAIDTFVDQNDIASLRKEMDQACTDPKLGVSYTADLFAEESDAEAQEADLFKLRSRIFESEMTPEQCYAVLRFAQMNNMREAENILRECAFTSRVEGHDTYDEHPNRVSMLAAFGRSGDTAAAKEYANVVAAKEAAAKKPIAENVSIFRNDVRGCCGDH